jgi:hypothetical protein
MAAQPLEPVFEKPLCKMQKHELKTVCERHGITISKSAARSKSDATKAVLLERLRGNRLIALHDADLEANMETANERRAREKGESDAMIFNPDAPHGRLLPTQIVITIPDGNIAVAEHHAFGAYQQRYFNGFGAAIETAPASQAPHMHVQAAGEIRLAEQSTKARQILKNISEKN